MTPTLLDQVGVLSQIAGTLVAFAGLYKTWHQFGAGERFRDRPLAWVRAMSGSIWSRLKLMATRLLGRPRKQVAVAGLAGGFTASASLRARITWGPLPETTEAALTELHRRTLDLSRTQADATERLDDAVAELRRDDVARRAQVDEAIERLGALNRQVAVGGVHWEALGLGMILFGLALQAVAR